MNLETRKPNVFTSHSTAGAVKEIILTHEHTDFDALASLLGAALLFPDAQPVLPYQLNRNVHEFVALYRNQFPFWRPKELPRSKIERVFLVDTRTANFPKGLQEETEFIVIDHHSLGVQLPSGWQVWSEAVGANTTLLVEKLCERQTLLTPAHATLLAIGIHEDTGSLTYASTTARDVRALAWLMEAPNSVNLDVLNQFLQHPLSEEQRTLLQTLIEQSEFFEVDGNTIVVASAQPAHFTSELSTVAHRLRNYHEPDALFMVVALDNMIQVVARSTTNAIDVGEVARVLGGGGHGRAAAASIHNQTTVAVRDQIIRLLHTHSHAAVNVRHIMSVGRPQMLSPDQTINQAATLMQRYGHEGFPVVGKRADGSEQLLGVLTRREADRALNHNLGEAAVRRFMQAGEVTVKPTDSVHLLRKTMIDSGWGQIPVVDEEGAIIGIVTRTDLIKLWDEATLPQRRSGEVDARLQRVLTPVQYAFLQLVGTEVDRLGYVVYVVGGFVRDLLLNGEKRRVDTLDMDIVIEGDAIAFAQHMQRLYGGRIVQHRRFGTAKWLLDDPTSALQRSALQAVLPAEYVSQDLPEHMDFVTARTEFYTAPTVLPTVEQGSIKLDLHRRDFTINTLALCLNPDRWGELLDFYGGLNDLNAGAIRVLHSLSFVDDPTRILRAVRYEQRFNFAITPRTLELLQDALELLDRVTPARVRHELERILQEAMPERALQRLYDLHILQQLHPALVVDGWVHDHFARLRSALAAPNAAPELLAEPIERLYWGVLVLRLPHAVHAELRTRLGLRGETERLMRGAGILWEKRTILCEATLRASEAVKLLEPVPPLALALTVAIELDRDLTSVLRRYTQEWRQVRPNLGASELQSLGLPVGPLFGKVLNEVRAALLDGQIHPGAEELRLAQAIARQLKNDFEAINSEAINNGQDH